MKKKLGLCLSIFLITVCFLTACGDNPAISASNSPISSPEAGVATPTATPSPTPTPTPIPTPEPTPTPTPEPAFEEYDISLMALGDNLLHLGIVYTGYRNDGTWDFSVLFKGMEDFLDTAHIKVINQETILGGNERGFKGFPHFNSPVEVADGIANAGFNVVLHASNHSADQELGGLLNCLSYWKKFPEVLVTGIYEEAADTHDISVLTIEGVRFAILNYTYSPNMGTIPEDIRGHLNILCSWNRENEQIDFTNLDSQVIEDIKRAEEIADVVIVCPHWGTEYTTEASSYQKKFATLMTEAGADLIIGTHPHVVQPVEWVESENGNRALCYYSLGNYVSSQKNALAMLEAMAWVTFTVKEDGVVISEEKTGAIPMVCHYRCNPAVRLEQVYLLEEYTEEKAAAHGIFNYGGITLTLEELQNWSTEILGDWILPAEKALGKDKDNNLP